MVWLFRLVHFENYAGHGSVKGLLSLPDEDFIKYRKPCRIAKIWLFGKSVDEGGISGLAAVKDCFYWLSVCNFAKQGEIPKIVMLRHHLAVDS